MASWIGFKGKHEPPLNQSAREEYKLCGNPAGSPMLAGSRPARQYIGLMMIKNGLALLAATVGRLRFRLRHTSHPS